MSTPGFVDPAAWRSSGLLLSTLLDRQTLIEWYEAVAIVQEVCALVADGRGSGPGASLEAGDVAITSEGGVEVRGGVAAAPPVAQVAHLLLALLAGAQALPVQLRLLALQEVSPTPGCATLRDFSNRLVPFERPNRRQAIRDVYRRFTQAPPREFERSATEAARPRAGRSAARPPWWRNRTVRSAAAAAVLLVAAGLAAAWLWQAVAPLLSGPDERANAATTAGGDSLSEADVERIWATARRIWGRTGARPAAPPPDAGSGPLPAAAGSAPSRPPAEPYSPAPPATSPVVGASPGTAPTVAEATLYSPLDADVLPPVLVRPRLPESPRPGVRAEDLPQVEVVVSETGEVESVKLVSERAGVGPAMMLSVIKAWRFAPATREGEPVRYRLRMRLTNQ